MFDCVKYVLEVYNACLLYYQLVLTGSPCVSSDSDRSRLGPERRDSMFTVLSIGVDWYTLCFQ